MIKEVLLCSLGVTNMSHDCQDETTNELPNDIPLRVIISWVVITIDRCQKTSFVTIPIHALFLYVSSPSVGINPLPQSHLHASTEAFMQQLHISLFVQTLDLICLAYNWTLIVNACLLNISLNMYSNFIWRMCSYLRYLWDSYVTSRC